MKEIINLVEISPHISTAYHLQELEEALDDLQTAFFQRRQPFITTLEQEIPFPLSDILKKIATEHEVQLDDVEEVDKFINKLRQELQHIQRLTVTISVPPTLDLIKDINRWIIANLKQIVVLDFVVDKTLIAGAKVEFKGSMKDFSIKHMMEQPMMAAAKAKPQPMSNNQPLTPSS